MSRSPPLYSFKDVLGLFGSPGPGCDPGTLFLGEAHWNNPLQSRVHSEAHTTDTRRGTPVSKDHKHQTKRNHLASAKHRQRRFGRAIVLWGAYLAFFPFFFFQKKNSFSIFPFWTPLVFPFLFPARGFSGPPVKVELGPIRPRMGFFPIRTPIHARTHTPSRTLSFSLSLSFSFFLRSTALQSMQRGQTLNGVEDFASTHRDSCS